MSESAEAPAGQRLPVRTSRRRPAGRHRSPDRLSVPPDAPALVLAFPGTATAASDGIRARIAAAAASCCPGVTVRSGYLEGKRDHLSGVLTAVAGHREATAVSAVVVPIVTGPLPAVTAALADAATDAGGTVVVTGCLGPHPLLAEALHTRLAEVGLARAGRMRQISIVSAAEGVIMAVAGDTAAAAEAGIVAVLLAARLAVPVVPAMLAVSASMADAVTRLADARATRLAIAPCVIGPEVTAAELTAAAATGVPQAAPLGAHPAIGQLAAIRYGAALQDPQIAGR